MTLGNVIVDRGCHMNWTLQLSGVLVAVGGGTAADDDVTFGVDLGAAAGIASGAEPVGAGRVGSFVGGGVPWSRSYPEQPVR